MALPRGILALALILVLVGSALAQGPTLAPSPAPSTAVPAPSKALAPPPLVVTTPPTQAPTLPPTQPIAPPTESSIGSPSSGPGSAPAPAPEPTGFETDVDQDNGALVHGSNLALLAVLGGVALFA